MASKKQVTVATKSTAVSGWADRMKALAEKQQKSIAQMGSASNWVSLKGGVVTVDGKAVPRGTLTAVVLAFMKERAYYVGEFDGNTPQSPTCYAYGDVDGDKPSEPHEKAATPQSDTCSTCEHAQFGSAERGRGQACREGIRLALLLFKDEELQDAVYFVRVPPTSMKHFAGWAANVDGPTCIQPVEISCAASQKNMFDVLFEDADIELTGEQQTLILAKLDVRAELSEPYPELEAKPAAKPVKKGVPRRGKF